MHAEIEFSLTASLLAEPARAIMLWNLMDGRALTATELAIRADVSAQSASMHLNKLVQAELVKAETQGRHRYFRIAKPEVAYAIEAIANLVPIHKLSVREGDGDVSGIRYCRTCYDHLAGKVAVAITEQMKKLRMIAGDGKNFRVTAKGTKWFAALGIGIAEVEHERRIFARQCLDWSERRPHLAGALGTALLNTMLESDWLRRTKNSRIVVITAKGRKEIHKLLGLRV